MSDVLLLTHRIPWPPDKGDKIRSYHLFCHLAEQYNLHLGTFVDAPEDWEHVPELERRCASVCVRPVDKRRAAWRFLKALSGGSPLTTAYYGDRVLARWISAVVADRKPVAALFFSSGMARFIDLLSPSCRNVLDMVDVDSEKWREYADARSWPRRWVFDREARLLSRDEDKFVSRFDKTVLISPHEAELMKTRCPGSVDRVAVVPNGVDGEYFTPHYDYPTPYEGEISPIVFTGAMDYWANIEGVVWFASSIFPLIHRCDPRTRFYIVGSKPAPEVRALERLPGVVVTGRVPDVRPYLAHGRLAVAPLRVARGLQNKVLEAMAMAKPVVATSAAMRGIDSAGRDIRVADTPEAFADAVNLFLEGANAVANREFVLERFSWSARLAEMDDVLLTGRTGG